MNLSATTRKGNVSPENHSSIPVRNAFSSVRKSNGTGSGQFGRLKPLRLSELTQEWLEAENEPLNVKQSIGEESQQVAESVASLTDDLADINVNSPERTNLYSNNSGERSNNESMDLGVFWLETPAKVTPSLSIQTPKPVQHIVNPVESATPYNAKISRDLVTPCNQKIYKKPKIIYSTSIKDCLKTPLDRIPEPKSVIKTGTRHMRFQGSGRKVSFQNANEEQILKFDKQDNDKENLQNVANNMHSFEMIAVHGVSYIILSKLGEGGSSVVYHCYNPKTHVDCAIKHVKLNNEVSSVGYINEVKLLERLQTCDRIIKLLDYELSENKLLMVLEKGGMDLSKILKELSSSTTHLPLHMVVFYWMEMLYAVKQIHENGIVHSDIKPANFIRAGGGLKLIDFGIACSIHSDMTSIIKDVPIGSLNYISPEALTNQSSSNCDSPSFGKPKYKVSYKSDVWSLGCILYRLVYKKAPFQHIVNQWIKISVIANPEHTIEYPESHWVPQKLVNTIKNCLQYDMKSRPSVDELIKECENIYF